MEDDGFTLVTGRKAAKKAIFKKSEDGTHIRVDGDKKAIENSMKSAETGILKSGLGKWIVQKLENISEDRNISRILLIGNGHFDFSDQQGAHQLALFLEISDRFNAEIVFQEPACSSAEKEWLEARNVKIRKELNVEIDVGEELTVLGIIHGEHEILNNFLEYNWETIEKSRNLIVIGNNYGGISWEISKLSEENERINQFYKKSIITPFPEIYEPHISAFSSTVIMYVVE